VFEAAFPPADCSVVTVSTPQAVPLHPLPESDHVRICEGFDPGTGVSVAVIAVDPAACTLLGADNSNVKLLVIVSIADAACEGSATLCAVSVTFTAAGKTCGAVKFPLASTVPHAEGHAAPVSPQRTAASGCPLLVITARKFCDAPSSTAAIPAEIVTRISLVTVNIAVADFVGSVTLIAVTCTIAGEGKSAGAVYTPAFEIVPTVAFPPAAPLTLHTTLVLLVFSTVAANICEFPNNTLALDGVTVMLTEAGGGVGGVGVVGCAIPEPSAVHPSAQLLAPSAASKVAVPQHVDRKLFLG
jgi:hypothetical protein